MGNRHSVQTQVRVVDNTDKVRAEREAQLRIDAENRRRQEEEDSRRANEELDKKLSIIDQGVAQLKNYTLGSLIPGMFNGINVSDVTKLRIALFGPTGSGKSSYINTTERVLRRRGRGTCNPQDTGGEGTIILEEFLADFFFRLVDTRGFFSYDADETEEFFTIVNGQIKDGEQIGRGTEGGQQRAETANRKVNFSEKIHACILVVKANDPRLANDTLMNYMSVPRKYLKENGITAVTLVTHADAIANDKRETVLAAASRATGSPANQTFFIANYTKDDCPRDPHTEEQALKVLQYALTAAERSVKIAKQRLSYALEPLQPAQQPVMQPTPTAVASNQDVTVISTLPSHNNKQATITTSSKDTCDEFLAQIKNRFKLLNLDDHYFADAPTGGRSFTGTSNLVEALRGKTTLYLRDYNNDD